MLPVPAVEDDATLVARALRGDDRAFATLVRRHAPYAAGVVHRVLGDEAEVDRALERGFAEAHSRLHGLREPAGFRSWVGRIVLRQARRRLRALRRRRWLAAVREWCLPRSALRAGSLGTPLERALARLRPSLRVPWALVELGGYTIEETASLCALPRPAVERRLVRARSAMERKIHAG